MGLKPSVDHAEMPAEGTDIGHQDQAAIDTAVAGVFDDGQQVQQFSNEGVSDPRAQQASLADDDSDEDVALPSDPESFRKRIGKVTKQRREAEAKAAEMAERLHKMEVEMARIQGVQTPDDRQPEEFVPYGIGDVPDGFDESLWRHMERATVASIVGNAKAIAEQMVAPLQQQVEALKAGHTDVQAREGRRLIDSILSDAITKYPVVKTEQARNLLESAMRGEFGGKPFNADAVRKFVMENAALLASSHVAVPGRAPMTPFSAPVAGFRGPVGGGPRRAPTSWEEATRGLKEAITFDDAYNRR